MPSIRKDSGWVKIPRDPTVPVHPDRIGVENYVRLVEFGTALNLQQLDAFCRQLEDNAGCPGLRVEAELLFGTNSTPVEYRFVTTYEPIRGPTMLHLTAVTPSGMSLIFEVSLTGNIDMCAGGRTVAAIEIVILAACARLRGDGVEELKGPANGMKRLWVRPDDLSYNGAPFKHEELVADAADKRAALAKETARGPLPENWP